MDMHRPRQPDPIGRVSGDLVSRTFGSAWFMLLAVMVASNWRSGSGAVVSPSVQFGGWPLVLSQVGIVLFYLTLGLMILIRPAPVARANRIMPTAMGFIGTYMPWLMGLFPRHELPAAGYLTATALILCGNVLTLFVVWHLGRSFSIVPQARRLVTGGPYSLVRHPLYLAEEMMVIGTALLCFSPMSVALVALHVVVQIRRMVYEEQVLSRAFSDYSAYMAQTWRTIPYVW